MPNTVVIDQDMIAQAWSKDLRVLSVLSDPYTSLVGNIDWRVGNGGIMLPDKVGINVKTSAEMLTEKMSIILPLSGSGITGETSMVGNEDSMSFRTMKAYADLTGNAVILAKYGRNADLERFYDLLGKRTPLLAQWHREIEGKLIREAICERYSSNLSNQLESGYTQYVNSNLMFCGGTAPVAFSKTAATYSGSINTASSAAANLTLARMLTMVEVIADEWKLRPVSVGGSTGYVFVIPRTEWHNLINGSSGSLNELVKYDKVAAVLGPDYAGSYNMLHFVIDPRNPRVDVQAATTTFSYEGPGNSGGRDAAGATIYNVGIILGQAAYFRWETMKLMWQEGIDLNYNREPGWGAFREIGFGGCEYDVEGSATASDRTNDGSALILFPTV